jgi:hypothetical protein
MPNYIQKRNYERTNVAFVVSFCNTNRNDTIIDRKYCKEADKDDCDGTFYEGAKVRSKIHSRNHL